MQGKTMLFKEWSLNRKIFSQRRQQRRDGREVNYADNYHIETGVTKRYYMSGVKINTTLFVWLDFPHLSGYFLSLSLCCFFLFFLRPLEDIPANVGFVESSLSGGKCCCADFHGFPCCMKVDKY